VTFSKSKAACSPHRKALQENIVAWNPGCESCVDLSPECCGVGSMQTTAAHTSLTIKSENWSWNSWWNSLYSTRSTRNSTLRNSAASTGFTV